MSTPRTARCAFFARRWDRIGVIDNGIVHDQNARACAVTALARGSISISFYIIDTRMQSRPAFPSFCATFLLQFVTSNRGSRSMESKTATRFKKWHGFSWLAYSVVCFLGWIVCFLLGYGSTAFGLFRKEILCNSALFFTTEIKGR